MSHQHFHLLPVPISASRSALSSCLLELFPSDTSIQLGPFGVVPTSPLLKARLSQFFQIHKLLPHGAMTLQERSSLSKSKNKFPLCYIQLGRYRDPQEGCLNSKVFQRQLFPLIQAVLFLVYTYYHQSSQDRASLYQSRHTEPEPSSLFNP